MDSLQRQPANIIDKTYVPSAYVYGRKILNSAAFDQIFSKA
jgi:hypothetical protein